MAELKVYDGAEWVPVLQARDGKRGAQGPPGPASPHEGSHIAVSVRQYGAVGDGQADDTAAVQAAIDAAGQDGFIDFESGTYLVTGPLTGFWTVTKSGPGILTDGTTEYRITPRFFGDLNTLWVNSNSGDDGHDGIFPGTARASLDGLHGMLQRMGPEVERGNWRVRLSGTFPGRAFHGLNHFRTALTFEGDPLVDGEPATVFQRVAGGSRFGLRFEPGNAAPIAVKNIAFRGFRDGGVGYGLIMKDLGVLDVDDCTFDDCDTGVAAVRNVSFSGRRLRVSNCNTGFAAVYSASGTWHECSADQCYRGFSTSRSAVAHIDYATISDCDIAIEVSQNSRIATIGGDFQRNGQVFQALGSGEYLLDDKTARPDFHEGTVDANGSLFKHRGVARETRLHGENSTNEFRNHWFYTPVVHTGTSERRNVWVTASGNELRPGFLTDSGKKITFRAYGELRGTGGGKEILFRRQDSDGSNTVPVSSYTYAANREGVFDLTVELVPYRETAGELAGIVTAQSAGSAPDIRSVYVTEPRLNAAKTRFRLDVRCASASDEIEILGFEIYLQG